MRVRSVVLLVLTAVLLTSPRVAPALAQADAGPSVVALPPVQTDDERFGLVQAIQAPSLAYRAGARWDRVVFPWSLIQKGGPNAWTELYYPDAALRAQVDRGVTMVGVMIYTPQWASTNPAYGQSIDVPQGLSLPYNDPKNTWGRFVRTLATRQKGVVDHWIIWNEPDRYDRTERYTWAGSEEEYARLLKVAYLNIKEVNPDAKVILGGLTYWWDRKEGREPYLARLLDVLRRDPDHERYHEYFDAVSLHVYQAPLNSYAIPMAMKRIMAARGISRPIWIDESNAVPTGDPADPSAQPHLAATIEQQAAYVIQGMALGLAAGVERYAIYKAVDGKAENGTDRYGLVRNDASLRPAYRAYQVATTYFQGVRSAIYSWPGSSNPPTGAEVGKVLASVEGQPQFLWPSRVSQVMMDRGDRRTTVVWNNSPDDLTYKLPAVAPRATLVTKSGETSTIEAKGGFYALKLPGSRHNADPGDASVYLIGGDPFIVDEPAASP